MMANGVHKIKFTYWDIKSMTDLSHFSPRFISIPPENVTKNQRFSDVFSGYRKRNIPIYGSIITC